MAQVKFKYGLFENLNKKTTDGSALNVPISDGTIYVTTDTHSMFIDLGNERFRIGDFERYKDLKDLVTNEKNWYEGSLALIETTDSDKNNANQTPILAYYTNGSWVNINDTTTLQTTLQGNIDEVAKNLTTLSGTVSGNSTSIAAIKADIGTRPEGTTATIWQAISNLIGGDGEGDLSLASLQAAIEKNAEDIGTNAGNISTNAENISKEVQRASTAESALGNRLTNIENDLTNNTANYATVTQVSTAKEEAISSANGYTDAQISAAKGEVNGYTDTKVAAEKSRAEGIETALRQDINSINNEDTGILAKAKEYTDALANGAVANNTQAIVGINDTTTGILAKAKEYTNEQVDIEEQRAQGVENALAARLNTLEKDDAGTGKSVREISAEEVAKIVDNADQSYDTLKEIADWILNDTTGAADMANDIADLQAKTVLGTYLDGEGDNATQKEYETVKDYVEAIERALIVRITATDNKLNWGTF